MSSGEADGHRVTLDHFRRCQVPGCLWRLLLADRCYEHGGPRVAQYVQDDEGAIIRRRFMPPLGDDAA